MLTILATGNQKTIWKKNNFTKTYVIWEISIYSFQKYDKHSVKLQEFTSKSNQHNFRGICPGIIEFQQYFLQSQNKILTKNCSLNVSSSNPLLVSVTCSIQSLMMAPEQTLDKYFLSEFNFQLILLVRKLFLNWGSEIASIKYWILAIKTDYTSTWKFLCWLHYTL